MNLPPHPPLEGAEYLKWIGLIGQARDGRLAVTPAGGCLVDCEYEGWVRGTRDDAVEVMRDRGYLIDGLDYEVYVVGESEPVMLRTLHASVVAEVLWFQFEHGRWPGEDRP